MNTQQQDNRAPNVASATLAVAQGSAISDPPKPLTPEEILTLKVAELTLHRDFVDTAARVLLRGVRPASKAQDLVLRADLEELKRRCDDAAKVSWPVLPNEKGEPLGPPENQKTMSNPNQLPTNEGQRPELALPPGSAVWAMISNHPYYPSIDFFATEEEARTAATKEIEDMHAHDGHHDESSVSVARIVAHAQIKTHY